MSNYTTNEAPSPSYAANSYYGYTGDMSASSAPPQPVKPERDAYGDYVALVWYYIWGIMAIWQTILGGLIYNWYPMMITNNYWWSVQCPKSAWVSSTITASTFATTQGSGSWTLTEVAVNGWTQYNCLRAAPIK